MQSTRDAAVAVAAAARFGVFSHADAITAGFTNGSIKRRLDAGRWEALHRGVYRIAGAPSSWLQDVQAACMAGGPIVIASHATAAALWDLPAGERTNIEVLVPKGSECTARGVWMHATRRLPPVDIGQAQGIPVTSPARLVIDMAARLDADRLWELVDAAVHARLASVARIEWRIRELGGRGRKGTRLLRAMLEEYRPGRSVPASVFESRLRRVLIAAGLTPPLCQHPVRLRDGTLRFIDLAYPELKIAIEAESYAHHGSWAKVQEGMVRRGELAALGWLVIEVSWRELRDQPERVVARITTAIAHRAAA